MRLALTLIATIAVPLTSATVARASANCQTLAEARSHHPSVHLRYRLDHGRQCWNDNGPVHRSIARRQTLTPLPTLTPVPRQSVLWPTLASTVTTPLDAALLTPEAATAWPLLLDVDAITGSEPPLTETPFTDRWFALPSNWFASMRGMK